MRLPAFEFAGSRTVLTGAAGGIGEQLAYQLADLGSELVLIDSRGEPLERVAATARDRGVRTRALAADLADTAAIEGLVGQILDADPRVDLLINNAGVALIGTFAETAPEDFDRVLAVNFRAPVALTHHLLPALRGDVPTDAAAARAGGAHIVNLSSVFGLIAPGSQTAYAASKFALRGFSESLRSELLPLGIGVTTVHPGGIRTDIARNARHAAGADPDRSHQAAAEFSRLLRYPPDRAAAKIITAVRRRRPRLLIGASAAVPDLFGRLSPLGLARVLERIGN